MSNDYMRRRKDRGYISIRRSVFHGGLTGVGFPSKWLYLCLLDLIRVILPDSPNEWFERGMPLMSEEFGISLNLISKGVKELKEAGLIEIKESGNFAGHLYRITKR